MTDQTSPGAGMASERAALSALLRQWRNGEEVIGTLLNSDWLAERDRRVMGAGWDAGCNHMDPSDPDIVPCAFNPFRTKESSDD